MNKEKELLQRIRSGEQECFSVLVRDLLPSAYKQAFLILKSKEHAEDALQVALEGVYISIMKNKDITNFKAWFYSIVWSRSIDIYRKNSRNRHNSYEEQYEVELKMFSRSAQQMVIQKETREEMIHHLQKLKSEQSLPLYLHYFEDMAIKDISLILNENVNTIKTRMKRGKQNLAAIMNELKEFTQEVKTHGI